MCYYSKRKITVMKLFMLHNIPPLPPFVCVCWMARIYKNLPEGQKNTKIWTEPSSFKKVIGTQKNQHSTRPHINHLLTSSYASSFIYYYMTYFPPKSDQFVIRRQLKMFSNNFLFFFYFCFNRNMFHIYAGRNFLF